MEGQGAEHHFKGGGREVHVLHGGADIVDALVVGVGPGLFQHLLRQIHPDHRRRAVVGGILAVPAEAAAQIQHPLAGEAGQQALQLVPLPGGGQALHRPGKADILFKKCRVIVVVFLHCIWIPL